MAITSNNDDSNENYLTINDLIYIWLIASLWQIDPNYEYRMCPVKWCRRHV